MIKSMTGYGRGESVSDKMIVKVEVRSINSKFFDLSVRMPQMFREKELVIRNLASEKLERGKVDLNVNIEYKGESKINTINHELATSYFNDLKKLAESLNQPTERLMNLVMKMPDVISASKDEIGEDEWKQLNEAVVKGIESIDIFRKEEGATLAKELESNTNNILNTLAEIEKLESERMTLQKARLRSQLEELLGKDGYDKNRFEQELIYYLERMDFSEEKVRLKSHCDFFFSTIQSKETNGRKLNFIGQEMGREINTLGSKANHAGIQKLVVTMKDELEKIKEQLLSIL